VTAYYNEIDPYAAQWLRNLIAAGLIAPGEVDERSIIDVKPAELAGFKQCHFFAGLGGWSLALRKANWADSKPIWSASCPCQPFSTAGPKLGFDDERHLWPALAWLIEQCGPAMVIGEQVASKAAGLWVDLVQADMEALGYAFGAVPFPAASVGAPNIRDRIYWVGDATSSGCQRERAQPKHGVTLQTGSNAYSTWGNVEWLECTDGRARPFEPGSFPLAYGATSRVGRLRAYGNGLNIEAAKVFIECLT
jgi:Site-specific DNA methylase